MPALVKHYFKINQGFIMFFNPEKKCFLQFFRFVTSTSTLPIQNVSAILVSSRLDSGANTLRATFNICCEWGHDYLLPRTSTNCS